MSRIITAIALATGAGLLLRYVFFPSTLAAKAKQTEPTLAPTGSSQHSPPTEQEEGLYPPMLPSVGGDFADMEGFIDEFGEGNFVLIEDEPKKKKKKKKKFQVINAEGVDVTDIVTEANELYGIFVPGDG